MTISLSFWRKKKRKKERNKERKNDRTKETKNIQRWLCDSQDPTTSHIDIFVLLPRRDVSFAGLGDKSRIWGVLDKIKKNVKDNERGSKGGWVWCYFIIHSVLTGRKEIDGHTEGGLQVVARWLSWKILRLGCDFTRHGWSNYCDISWFKNDGLVETEGALGGVHRPIMFHLNAFWGPRRVHTSWQSKEGLCEVLEFPTKLSALLESFQQIRSDGFSWSNKSNTTQSFKCCKWSGHIVDWTRHSRAVEVIPSQTEGSSPHGMPQKRLSLVQERVFKYRLCGCFHPWSVSTRNFVMNATHSGYSYARIHRQLMCSVHKRDSKLIWGITMPLYSRG